MSAEERRPMIVTFKKKDQRSERELDKQAILRRHVKERMEFCDIISMQDTNSIPASMNHMPTGLDVNLYDLPILAGSFTEGEIQSLRADENVEVVEEDYMAYAVQVGAKEVPLPGPAELIREDIPATYAAETIPWGINRIDAERAWEVTRGAGIRVAVIDTGIDHLHHDLNPNFAGGVSFVEGESFTDGNGHGTHVAGIIGARQNGSGVIGVAPNCSLYSVKALNRLGHGRYSSIISAILWSVRNRMDVINMSLGGSSHSQALQNACDYAYQHNVLLVAAAGNTHHGAVGFPAAYDSVIAVSAIDKLGNLASFSAKGSQVDLCAPGVQIYSTLPGNRYGHLNGTSMASPHVAGAAALAVSSHRFTRAESIRKLLEISADNLGVPGRDDMFGHGLVDAEQCAFMRTLH